MSKLVGKITKFTNFRSLGIINNELSKNKCINRSCLNSLFLKQTRKTSTTNPVSNNDDYIDVEKLLIFNRNNLKNAYSDEKLIDLLISYSLLKISSSDVLLDNYEKIIKYTRALLGNKIFEFLVKNTVYTQFIAGSDESSVDRRLKKMALRNIGGIIDYAVESDIPTDNDTIKSKKINNIIEETPKFDLEKFSEFYNNKLLSKTAIRPSEKDDILNRFLQSIHIAEAIKDPPGYVALKVTSICDTLSLQKTNDYFVILKTMFYEKIGKNKSYMDMNDFYDIIKLITNSQISKDDCNKIFLLASSNNKNEKINFYDFVRVLFPIPGNTLMHAFISNSKLNFNDDNKLNLKNINDFENCYNFIDFLSAEAKAKGVRLMIDAEQTYFQESIHLITLLLQNKYNINNSCTLFNTYQAYLKKTYDLLEHDFDYRDNVKQNFLIGAKLVRGAYDNQERKLAKKLDIISPVCDTYDDTNSSFDRCADLLVKNVSEKSAALVIASHNSDSISMVTNRMRYFKIDSDDPNIGFAQLLGMSGFITNILGKNNFNVYKYMPYGPVNEVLPYLARRISENRSVFKRIKVETDMILSEICKRTGIPTLSLPHFYKDNRNINSH